MTFSASASDGASGIAGAYSWSFGDNTPGQQGASPSHTYSAPGTYRVTVAVTDGAGNAGTAAADIVVSAKGAEGGVEDGAPNDEGAIVKPPAKDEIGGKFGTQTASVGVLDVIAPKKYRIGKKPTPILMTLIASKPGTFQAALSKGPKVVSKGAGILTRAGTFGFKLKLPKRLVAGTYKLRLTYVPEGTSSGSTKTISIKFFRAPARRGRAAPRAARPFEGPVNVDAGPPAAGHGG